MWSGTTYALAACMLQEKQPELAWETALGVYKMTYALLRLFHIRVRGIMTTYLRGCRIFADAVPDRYENGYWYQTPEAWDAQGHYRAISYMRPLAVWHAALRLSCSLARILPLCVSVDSFSA